MSKNKVLIDNSATQNESGKRKGFTSKIGFILAAAGSAVGLGNMWRFPYLAATYGGGIFVLCYMLLAINIGFILLILEFAIGRKTGKGVVAAFEVLCKKFKWVGYVCLIVPIIVTPYYSVIGGWVIKYFFSFLIGSEGLVAGAGAVDTTLFFNGFISNAYEPLIFFLIFAIITVVIVAFGVQKGIEKMSKILMPILTVLAVGLMIYVLCQQNALEGAKYFLIPDFSKFSFSTVLAAMGQLFYSLSIAMGIMITYGSYMKKEDKITSSATQICIFDTLFAVVAGLIIIPAVFAFSSTPESVLATQGPSLMFIQLPQIFNAIPLGRVIGTIFFLLVFFAALTSSISLLEAIIASFCENGKMSRIKACLIVSGIVIVLGTLSSLGFGVLDVININGKSILDMFDFAANNILMPIVAILTCVVASWFIDKNMLPNEIGLIKPASKGYFNVMIRYVAPTCIAIILISGLFITL